MIKAPGEGYDKLLEVIDIIETERAIFQVDDQFVDKRSKRERSKAPIVGNTSSGSNPRGIKYLEDQLNNLTVGFVNV